MEGSNINWPELQTGGFGWRDRLWVESLRLLTGSDPFELSRYNNVGYFHRVRSQSEFRRMRQTWRQLKSVPPEWIGKGTYPGIWTALFDPCNTISFARPPIMIVRFYFRQGYFIFDIENQRHRELLDKWTRENKDRENPWQEIKDGQGQSLKNKTRLHRFPSHKGFFEDNNFGALIGYYDYISVVIVLEGSIQEVEFSVLKQAAR